MIRAFGERNRYWDKYTHKFGARIRDQGSRKIQGYTNVQR